MTLQASPVVRKGNVLHDHMNVTSQELEKVLESLWVVVGPEVLHRLLAGLEDDELLGEGGDERVDLPLQLDEAVHLGVAGDLARQVVDGVLQPLHQHHPLPDTGVQFGVSPLQQKHN